MRLNQTLIILFMMAIVLLVMLGFYQIFLTPPETIPSSDITPISEEYGDDVLDFIQQER